MLIKHHTNQCLCPAVCECRPHAGISLPALPTSVTDMTALVTEQPLSCGCSTQAYQAFLGDKPALHSKRPFCIIAIEHVACLSTEVWYKTCF